MIILKLISLFILFVFAIAIFTIVGLLGNIRSVFRQFTAGQRYGNTNSDSSASQRSNPQRDSVNTKTATKSNKIIPKDEGEYVDYEEVKD